MVMAKKSHGNKHTLRFAGRYHLSYSLNSLKWVM